ncbi:MAG: hypothetical protein K2Y07_01820 [Nitrosomonas sp.]|nr:hypothetical protein [Nitrosomonas sp.]
MIAVLWSLPEAIQLSLHYSQHKLKVGNIIGISTKIANALIFIMILFYWQSGWDADGKDNIPA